MPEILGLGAGLSVALRKNVQFLQGGSVSDHEVHMVLCRFRLTLGFRKAGRHGLEQLDACGNGCLFRREFLQSGGRLAGSRPQPFQLVAPGGQLG
ncbi:hypothetical protein SB776_33975, partial [Burkholderia sp. SIMBA_045]